jgi:hypothetical protein
MFSISHHFKFSIDIVSENLTIGNSIIRPAIQPSGSWQTNLTKQCVNYTQALHLAILQVLVPHTYDYLPQPFRVRAATAAAAAGM